MMTSKSKFLSYSEYGIVRYSEHVVWGRVRSASGDGEFTVVRSADSRVMARCTSEEAADAACRLLRISHRDGAPLAPMKRKG